MNTVRRRVEKYNVGAISSIRVHDRGQRFRSLGCSAEADKREERRRCHREVNGKGLLVGFCMAFKTGSTSAPSSLLPGLPPSIRVPCLAACWGSGACRLVRVCFFCFLIREPINARLDADTLSVASRPRVRQQIPTPSRCPRALFKSKASSVTGFSNVANTRLHPGSRHVAAGSHRHCDFHCGCWCGQAAGSVRGYVRLSATAAPCRLTK